jgi:hypothetical protein
MAERDSSGDHRRNGHVKGFRGHDRRFGPALSSFGIGFPLAHQLNFPQSEEIFYAEVLI